MTARPLLARCLGPAFLVLLCPSAPASADARGSAQEAAPRLEAPIVSAALFKNGVAVVRRRATLPGPGSFEVGGVPEALHGTLWLHSSAAVEARTVEREVELGPQVRPGGDLQSELAGCEVTLTLRTEGEQQVRGRIVDFGPPAAARPWSRHYEDPLDWRRSWPGVPRPGTAALAPTRFLAVDTLQGRTLFDAALIGSLVLHESPPPLRTREALLELTLREPPGPVEVELSYLCKGLSWAPSLRLDIAHPEVLAISQAAVLRNELEDLDGVELELISGFPSIEFSHVVSPFSPRTTWMDFFRQLAQDPRAPSGSGMVVSQQIASNVALHPDAFDPAALMATGEGVDLEYRAIGRRSLREGEALHLTLAEGHAPYERVVEWRIPDTRDEWGRHVDWSTRARRQGEDEGPWDALRFANPFDFPLTTAPATIVAGSRFQGQRTSTWVNPGEETLLRVTKALSVRVRAAEHEAEAEREHVVWGGRNYRRVRVEGELVIANHRQETVSLQIRREFSGELDSADEAPRARLLERGVYSVNRRQELIWNLSLASGEERRLRYAYAVLVRHH